MAGDGRYSEMSTQSMNSSYLQSERIHSQEAAFEYDDRYSQSDDQYSFRDDDRYSQNGYGSERGGDSRISNNDQYERGDSRLSYASVHSSSYPLQPSSAVGRSGYERLDIQQQAPRRPPHRYDLPPDASRLPPNGGRASAQPSSGIRVESRPDSSNSAPPLRNSDPHSSGASSITGLYANGNIRNEPRSRSPIYLEPPRPPSSSSSLASRVNSATRNNLRNEAPPQSPPPQSSAASTRPPSVASSIHSQNGYGHHGSQILSAQREPFPQSGEPRYRNMVLYERSEYISQRLASILDQMDSYLTNPAPKIRESIKMERSAETMRKMPEFEALVDRLLK
uniref:Uncharacterized protein n=1 Tax=Panagrolaimus davidi TaxID=227884 RepID=A0A914Q0L7_9BILA